MIKALRGMKDTLGDDAKSFEAFIEVATTLAKNYGYSYISTPILEELSLFRRSVGDSSDIVSKEMYNFTDKGNNNVCLRPEGTAGVVRSFIEKKFDRIATPKRFYYYGPMFRYERPQKGRFRQFNQFGCESFANSSYLEDINIILLIKAIFDKLQIKYDIKLNSLGCPNCMPKYKELLLDFLEKQQDICEDCTTRKEKNVIRVLDCKNVKCQDIYQQSPKLDKHLCGECSEHFEQIKTTLTKQNISFEIDLNLVRGLDYYTKTAFEFVSNELGSQGAIAGGGRYDLLISQLGGRQTSAIGFAIGIERVQELLKQKEKEINKIYICCENEESLNDIVNITQSLRQTNQVHFAYDIKNINFHFKKAKKDNYKYLLFIGVDEFNDLKILVKNIQNSIQELVLLTDIGSHEFL